MMNDQLTPFDIVCLGRAHETLRYWRKLNAVIHALYGEHARYVTQTILTVPRDDGLMRGVQFIVTDGQQRVLPFAATATWWQRSPAISSDAVDWPRGHLDDLLGASLPEPQQAALREYIEHELGIEFLTVWSTEPPLVNSLDLLAEPALPYADITASVAGEQRLLGPEECIVAGKEYENYLVWENMTSYVRTLYGKEAVKMQITTHWVYNDSGYNETPTFIVTDADGERLFYDLSLSWWANFRFSSADIAAYQERHPRGKTTEDYEMSDEDEDDLITEGIRNALNMLRRDLLGIAFAERWLEQGATFFEAEETMCDLVHAPSLTYTQLIARTT